MATGDDSGHESPVGSAAMIKRGTAFTVTTWVVGLANHPPNCELHEKYNFTPRDLGT